MTGRALVARLDSLGDVLLAGPAVRAVAAESDYVAFLAGPRGRPAASMLPGVDDVLDYHAPWVDLEPPELTADGIYALIKQIRDQRIDRAIILTSFHQSPLPLALVLRMAEVPWIGAISVDYPGSLLDLRHSDSAVDMPESKRALELVRACGYELPDGDDGRLRIRRSLPDMTDAVGPGEYVVLHPGAAVPARRMSIRRSHDIVGALQRAGFRVVITGGPDEVELTGDVWQSPAVNLGGRTTFSELAAVLAGASVVIAPNTAAAHLAAAVGTPVVSLFAPVVPVDRWGPHGVPHVVLGDQQSPCASSRARICPVPGHPCLEHITDDEIVAAVERLEMS